MSTVHYRKLTVDDYMDALALYNELHSEASVISGAWVEDRFAQILHHDGTTIFGAVFDGAVVSMATLHILPNMTYDGRPYCLIENVITHHADQGQGYGRGVIEQAVKTAWDARAYKIMLLSGKSNDAKGFYEKCGFREDEKHGMVLRRTPLRDTLD